jgi:hypothetical protein
MSDRQFDVYLDDVKSLSTAITNQLAEMIHAQALKPWEFHRAIYDRCDAVCQDPPSPIPSLGGRGERLRF